jgi:hypothetical protein
MKREQKKGELYCVDCTESLMGGIYFTIAKTKLYLIKMGFYQSFSDGDRCKTCAKNHKTRVNTKKLMGK